jgi:hypothetical protein
MRAKLSRKYIYVAVGVVLIAAVTFIIMQLLAPRPSVTAYCKLYKDENVATAQSYSPKDFENIYAKLEQVAPNDIKEDTTVLRKIYQKIESDPSQSFSASFSGLTSETNIKTWVKENCI